MPYQCQIKASLAVETAAIQTKSSLKLRACAGYQILGFALVRRTFGALTRNGGLCFSSREFYEAVGELAEGQAPHPKAWDERLS